MSRRLGTPCIRSGLLRPGPGFSRSWLRWGCGVGEDGHAEVDQLGASVSGGVLEAVELGHRGVEADLETLDFSEPAVAAGLADAVAEVLDDLDDAATLAGVDLEDRAADAGLSEPVQLDAELVREVRSRRKVVVKKPGDRPSRACRAPGWAVTRA